MILLSVSWEKSSIQSGMSFVFNQIIFLEQ